MGQTIDYWQTAFPACRVTMNGNYKETCHGLHVNVLHLIPDEKFVKFMQQLFQQLPGVSNRWVVHSAPGSNQVKHADVQHVWRSVGTGYMFSRDMSRDVAWSDCVILHSLGLKGARLALKAPPRVAVVWSAWGGDYYRFFPGGMNALMGDETRQLLRSTASDNYLSSASNFVRQCARAIAESVFLMRAIERVDLISLPLPEEFGPLQTWLGSRLRAEYVQLNYRSVEHTFAPGSHTLIGNDILLGNSATPTNNHIEIINMLAKRNLARRKVIVPLAYGDSNYRDAIVSHGKVRSRHIGNSLVRGHG